MKTNRVLNAFFTIVCVATLFSTNQSCGQQRKGFGIQPVMKIINLANEEKNPMKLDNLKIDIKVIGQIATTTLDMTYFNDNENIKEGEFNFPLGEGQTVTRFALDIDGEMREGVVVEKEKGRKTFEAVVRRKVDPGLLEMTVGNNFRARVYPLPGKGTRRIIIAYEQELINDKENDLYLLPLNIIETIRKFSIHIEVIKKQVELNNEKNEFNTIQFKKWNESLISDVEFDNYMPDKQIALQFPQIHDQIKVFTASIDNSKDSSLFYLTVRPKFFEKTKVLPKRITVFWDNSGSTQTRNLSKELSVLEKYIKKIGNCTVQLVPFNISIEKPKIFEISKGFCDSLISFLQAMRYDGATSYGNIQFSKYDCDEILFFSDGISNFGAQNFQASKVPIITINSNNIANHSTLNYLAQNSGGIYLNLNNITDEEAILLITTNNYHFISAKIDNGNISELFPSISCQFKNSFSMAGIIKGTKATLTLNFGFGKNIVHSEQISINVDNKDDAELLKRIWAVKKINELMLNEEKNNDAILDIGKKHHIVTKNTSLIVLENLEDYIQYRIVPPKKMQADYFSRINLVSKEKSDKENTHINEVITLSDDQTKWWKTVYPLPLPKQQNKSKSTVRYVAPEIVDSVSEGNFSICASASSLNAEMDTSRLEGVFQQVDEVVEENKQVFGEGLINSKNKESSVTSSDIQINAWDPQTPYFKVLQYASKGQEYETYLKLKSEYGSTPAFYIDASDFFSKLGKTDIAVGILSNLAELKLESPQLLRVFGHKLIDFKRFPEAVNVFEKVLKLKGEEPQSFRDLGLALAANSEFQKAIETLYEVVRREWDDRFPDIELITMNEINSIIQKHPKLNYSFIDKRLLKKEPVDIRVELSWDTDNSDMDLWVTEPNGEKCFFQNLLTKLGGKISRDNTGGYGPEEYMIKNAKNGVYQVQANYYGTSSQSILAPVNLHLSFITNFGKANEQKQQITIRLETKKEVIDVGKFQFQK